jgi:subtilisin-like proprotein convertase family protein
MSTQARARSLGGAKKVALLLLAAGLAAVAALGLASAASAMTMTFSNNNGITINDGSSSCRDQEPEAPVQATPYPFGIGVGGLGSSVTDVNVTLRGLTHTWPDDIGVLLVSPAGQSTILMADSGGGDDVSGVTLTFDDAASGTLPDESLIESGNYKPSVGSAVPDFGCSVPQSFPTDATGTNPPAGPYGSSLSVFNGSDPNGGWKIYVIDDTRNDPGSIIGFSLEITTEDTTPPTVEVSPAHLQTGVATTANVTATFSEEVQGVTRSTFTLERVVVNKRGVEQFRGVRAQLSTGVSGGLPTATLDPAKDLKSGSYRVTVTNGVTDMAGNPLEPWTSNFTTASSSG